MDPVIEEMLRASGEVRPYVWARWQRHLREVIQPQLDELARVKLAKKAGRRKAEREVPAA